MYCTQNTKFVDALNYNYFYYCVCCSKSNLNWETQSAPVFLEPSVPILYIILFFSF